MILCLGTTPVLQRTMTFERLSLDAVNRAVSVETSTGGKALNVARALRTLGELVVAIGFLGGDSGRFIRRKLDEAGIGHDFVEVEPPTRTCVTVIDRAAGTATELIEEPQALAAEDWAKLGERFSHWVPQADVAVLSGSLPPGGSDDFNADCVRRAGDVPVIVDARGEGLRLALAARPFLVKPNRAELAATVGMAIDSDDALREAIGRLMGQGPRWAAVTLGSEGAVLGDGRSLWRIRVPAVKVVSAIGSGDAFAAGLAAGIARKQEMIESATLAAACSVANALTSLPGVIAMEDVNMLIKEIRVQKCQGVHRGTGL